MRVEALTDPEEFLQRLLRLTGPSEARHNLIIGLATTLIRDPQVYPDYRLWTVDAGGRTVAAALRTLPYNLVLAEPAAAGALAVLTAAVFEAGEPLPGVAGTRPFVDEFVAEWARLGGGQARLALAQGIFALERVVPVTGVAGGPRRAGPADRDLVLDWVVRFQEEAVPDPGRGLERLKASVDHRLSAEPASSGYWLWEVDGEARSLTSHGGRTPNGVRIGPVYTPPEHRGRGYASALVAAQSAWLLDHGHRFCFLYTDLANPTSNAIYRRIGYHQVAEAAEFHFDG